MPALQQALWTPLGRLLAWLLRAVRGSLPVGPKALSEDLLRLQKQRALTGQSNGQDISLNEHSPVLSACSPRLHSAWSPPTRAALAAAVQSDPEAKAYRAYAAEAPAADTLVVDDESRLQNLLHLYAIFISSQTQTMGNFIRLNMSMHLVDF